MHENATFDIDIFHMVCMIDSVTVCSDQIVSACEFQYILSEWIYKLRK